MTKKETLGDRIKIVRGEMSQSEFAEVMGIGRSTLIRYEQNESTPDTDFIMSLHVRYGVQPLWLITGMGQSVVGEMLNKRELKMLANYRSADAKARGVIESMCELLAQKPREEKQLGERK